MGFGITQIKEVLFQSVLPRTWTDKETKLPKTAYIGTALFMGGTVEVFVPEAQWAGHWLNAVTVGQRGILSGEMETRVIGERMTTVVNWKSFHPDQVAAEPTNGVAKRGASAPAGFARLGTMIGMALLSMLAFAAASRAGEFVLQNTQTTADGTHFTVPENGDEGFDVYYDAGNGFGVDISGSKSDWAVEVLNSDNGVDVFYNTNSLGTYDKPYLGGWAKVDGVLQPFGGAAYYAAPFEVPEPASGAVALGSGSLLMARRRVS